MNDAAVKSPGPARPATTRVYAVLTLAEGVRPDALQPLLEAEEAVVWALYRRGVLREMHLFAERAGALLVFEAAGSEAAAAYLRELPLVQEGLLDAEVFPVRPFVNLELLFEARFRAG